MLYLGSTTPVEHFNLQLGSYEIILGMDCLSFNQESIDSQCNSVHYVDEIGGCVELVGF